MKRYLVLLLLFFTLSAFHKDPVPYDISTEEWSPLMMAIYKSDTKKFTKLIKKRQSLTFKTSGKKNTLQLTALDVAIRSHNTVAEEMLLKTGEFNDLNDYLITACSGKSAKALQLLLDHGADPNLTLENGYNPLLTTVDLGSPEVLHELLQKIENVNHKYREGKTALMRAAANLNIEKVKILLANGADKSITDDYGKTAFDHVYPYKTKTQPNNSKINQLKELLK